MNRKPHPAIRIAAGIVLAIPLALIVWKFNGPGKIPDLPRLRKEAKRMEAAASRYTARQQAEADMQFLRKLLGDGPDQRDFPFATVAEANSGKKVIPLDGRKTHKRVTSAIKTALDRVLKGLSAEDSPVRSLRHISGASRHFEGALREVLNAEPDLTCDAPHNRRDESPRIGYPGLQITFLQTGEVFYFNFNLVEDGSRKGSQRSFCFTSQNGPLKINDEAVHLLAEIDYDGKDGEWTFTRYELSDLSQLRVRIKSEFEVFNASLYQDCR